MLFIDEAKYLKSVIIKTKI